MNLIAKPFGFEGIAQYRADAAAVNVPVVNFD